MTPDELTAEADRRGLPKDGLWASVGDYYSRTGEPLSMRQWTAATESREGRRVAFTALRGAHVSTVWLGLDHGFGTGQVLIFETMVFTVPEDARSRAERRWLRELQYDCWRWGSEGQAIAGHDQVVMAVRELLRKHLPTAVQRRAERRRLQQLLRAQ